MYPLLYAPWTSSLDGYVRNINVAIIIIIIITIYMYLQSTAWYIHKSTMDLYWSSM